jgi:hypothetical protein
MIGWLKRRSFNRWASRNRVPINALPFKCPRCSRLEGYYIPSTKRGLCRKCGDLGRCALAVSQERE